MTFDSDNVFELIKVLRYETDDFGMESEKFDNSLKDTPQQ